MMFHVLNHMALLLVACYLRRFKGIICGEVNREEEHSTLVWAVILKET